MLLKHWSLGFRPWSLVAYGDRIRRRMRAAVGDRDQYFVDAQLLAHLAGRAAEDDFRPAPHFVTDLDIAPLNAAGPAGAEALEYRLLGGKAAGIMLRGCFAGGAILDLVRRIDARQKQLAMPLDHLRDPQAF